MTVLSTGQTQYIENNMQAVWLIDTEGGREGGGERDRGREIGGGRGKEKDLLSQD